METFVLNGKTLIKCNSCRHCITKRKESDPYGGILFQNDQWDTYNECSLTKRIVVGYDLLCPLLPAIDIIGQDDSWFPSSIDAALLQELYDRYEREDLK